MENLRKYALFIFIILFNLSSYTIFDSSYFSTVAQAKSSKKQKKKRDILNSKTVKKINKRQTKRLAKINQYKAKKYIGETTEGLLKVRTYKGLSKKIKTMLDKLVRAENKDRNKLYSIIVKANKYDKKKESVLRMSMFQARFDLDPIGTYYYEKRTWQKK